MASRRYGRRQLAVRMTGDWPQAHMLFMGLRTRLVHGTQEALEQESKAIVRRLRHNIQTQQYPHAAVSEHWAKQKQDPRTLINTGSYLDSIHAFPLRDKNGWAVGVTDPSQTAKGAALEAGADTQYGEIPARPHWSVELERARATGLPTLRQTFFNVVKRLPAHRRY